MKKLSTKKSVFAMVLMAAGLAVAQVPIAPQGFCDSTCGSGVLRGTPKIPLKYQELQEIGSPIVNTYTTEQITQNVTQQITQQVTQTIQPDTYVASGAGSGYNSAAASADCGGGGVMLSGGGSCENGQGLVAVAASQPSGNGWYISCGAGFQNATVFATAYAVCSRR